MRIDPPMSEPLASVEVPAARLAPDPPEEPPTANLRFQGLRVTPQIRECVKPAQENSGAVERACTIAPDSRIRRPKFEVSGAIVSAKMSEPWVHGSPASGSSSLTAVGMPSRGRGGCSAAHVARLGGARLLERALEEAYAQRIDLRLDPLGACDDARHELDGRQLAPPKQPQGLGGGQVVQIRHCAPAAVVGEGVQRDFLFLRPAFSVGSASPSASSASPIS